MNMNVKRQIMMTLALLTLCMTSQALDHRGITVSGVPSGAEAFSLINSGQPVTLAVDEGDCKGVMAAVRNLQQDFGRVCGTDARLADDAPVIIGTLGHSRLVDKMLTKAQKKELQGKREKYLMVVTAERLIIAGSDRRGTIYGIYELSEQIGVSPWYFWADVPARQHRDLSLRCGTYTAGEPAVRYRGLFLNDEDPCLTHWVYDHYHTSFGNHAFYRDVFELILRLRGNFLWPAMWCWTFYGDDADNLRTADEMGIIMGTSHHEPMARNHQEYVRNRARYGAWNYRTNREGLDRFFREGMERVKDTEDLITIGMRGDGDEAMSETEDLKLMEEIISNQRRIISDVTGQSAKERPQVWALYKEVLEYYNKGLRVPDDVTILLCDDNWGDVCRLPNSEERKRSGGWGMYYHADYVGAPRNSKLLNVTPIQNMWEQLQLTYDYGVDRLWILNVGDLKPMEYPITLFMDMAWKPRSFTVETLMDHPRQFCAYAFGDDEAREAADILNLYSKYNGRVTPEMLDRNTYNLSTGEWAQVAADYAALEARALRQYLRLPQQMHDAYNELLLFPVQLCANLYEMYYAQAMNHQLYAAGDSRCNQWADRVEQAFRRDSLLMLSYNRDIASGKWKGMMTQKHIGYQSWNDDFAPADVMPEVKRIAANDTRDGGYVFTGRDGQVVIEAEHYYSQQPTEGTRWAVLPDMGRTLSAMTLLPYSQPAEGASLSYRMQLPKDVRRAKVHVIIKSTLAFANPAGHSYRIGFDGGDTQTVVFNADLNERRENVYSRYYPTVARRVIEKVIDMQVPPTEDGLHTLTFSLVEPGTVLEKLVIDYGGYERSYLFGKESEYRRSE